MKEDDHMIKEIYRGEIYLVDFKIEMGSEQHGMRPALIIQNDIGNHYSSTTIIALISSHVKKKCNLPTHILIKARDNLPKESVVLLEQIRTIDKERLRKRLSQLTNKEMSDIKRGLEVSLEL